MNAKEKYNEIILFIESEISTRKYGEIKKSEEIIKSLQKKFLYDARQLSLIFEFFLNQTLSQYVKKRMMIYGYQKIISSNPNFEEIAYSCGFSTSSSFSKAFTNMFGISPSEAAKKKDSTILDGPLTWDRLELEELFVSTEKKEENSFIDRSNSIFGISRNSLNKYFLIKELQVQYGFSDFDSEVAFQISEKTKTDINHAFRFLGDYFSTGIYDDLVRQEYDESTKEIKPENVVNKILFEEPEIVLILNGIDEFSYFEMKEIIQMIKAEGTLDISANVDLIKLYKEFDYFTYKYIRDGYNFYFKNYPLRTLDDFRNDLDDSDFLYTNIEDLDFQERLELKDEFFGGFIDEEGNFF